MAETATTAPVAPSTTQATDTSTNTPQATPPQAAAAPPKEEFFDIKVNNKIIRMTKQEAMDHASMSFAANQKFDEASKIRKQNEAWKQKAKQDAIAALQEQGLSKEEIRDHFEKWYTKEFIEPETLNEDQRKNREYEARLKKYEQEEQAKKQKEDQDKDAALTAKERTALSQQIIDLLESSGLPKTKFTASRIAFYKLQNMRNGWQAPDSLIIKQVMEDRRSLIGDISENSTAEQLIEMWGESAVNKIRKYDLERLRQSRGGLNQAAPSRLNGAGTGVVHQNKISEKEVKKRLNAMRQGKL